jgi:hypothetical protein
MQIAQITPVTPYSITHTHTHTHIHIYIYIYIYIYIMGRCWVALCTTILGATLPWQLCMLKAMPAFSLSGHAGTS